MLIRALAAFALAISAAGPIRAEPDRDSFLDLARKGWGYELRTTMLGRDMSIPVRINGQDLAGAAICIVGEEPRPQTLEVLNEFRALLTEVYDKPLPMRFAGPTARLCGTGRTVILRLYSHRPPNEALTDDLLWMNETLQLGLPRNRVYMATSPAMAQTFFGRRGQGTHVMVKQPPHDKATPLETAFYRSILIEELFQSFTFGMDILHLDRDAAFRSKLEEFPVNLMNLPWDSRQFMQGLLESNPSGLCQFDVFMLLAVARAPVEQTTDPVFMDYIDEHYDALLSETRGILADGRFAEIRDTDCGARGD